LNPPPQPVSGDISTKQTVAICIRRVSIQSDLSATRIVAATWSSSPPSKSLRWLSGILTHLGLPMRATAFTGMQDKAMRLDAQRRRGFLRPL